MQEDDAPRISIFPLLYLLHTTTNMVAYLHCHYSSSQTSQPILWETKSGSDGEILLCLCRSSCEMALSQRPPWDGRLESMKWGQDQGLGGAFLLSSCIRLESQGFVILNRQLAIISVLTLYNVDGGYNSFR